MKTEEKDLLLTWIYYCGCGYKIELYTSKTVEKVGVNAWNKGMKPFEVNFREGVGLCGLFGDGLGLGYVLTELTN